jgi:MFS family permease
MLRRTRLFAVIAVGLHALLETAHWVSFVVFAFDAKGARVAGLLALASLLFAAAVAPVASALIDRLSRVTAYRLAASSQVVSVGVTGFAVMRGAQSWLVCVLSFLAAGAVTATRPVHYALLPEIIDDPADLVPWSRRSRFAELVGNTLGPMTAAGMMTLMDGAEGGFLASAGAGVVCLLLTFGMRVTQSRRDLLNAVEILGDGASVFGQLKGQVGSISVLTLIGTQFVVIGALDLLLISLADNLERDSSFSGVLASGFAGGSMIGSLGLASRIRGSMLRWVLVGGSALLATMFVIVPFGLPGSLLACVAAGIGYSTLDLASRTLLPRSVPATLLGRVYGLQEMAIMLGCAVGALLAPLLVDAAGLGIAFVLIGCVPLAWAATRSVSLRSIDANGLQRESVMQLVSSSPLFRGASPTVISAIAAAMRPGSATTGSILMREGDPGDHMLLIAKGTCDVDIGGVRTAMLHPGDHAGEIALLRNVPRTATVRATSDLVTWSLDREAFLCAVTAVPGAGLLQSPVS